jgi:hypothetical protein
MVDEIKYIFIVLVLKKMTFETYIDQHVPNARGAPGQLPSVPMR